MSVSAIRVRYFSTAVSFIATLLVFTLFSAPALATNPVLISPRSLKLQNSATGTGGSLASGIVDHQFNFTIPTAAGSGQSIEFKYCTNANIDTGGTCTTPHGLSTTGAGVKENAETGDAATFTTFANTTNGAMVVSAAAAVPASNIASSVQFTGVTNPDGTDCTGGATVGCTFFVQIEFYSGSGATGTLLASGTVAASVNQQIQLTGQMPESLIFCTGGTVKENVNNIPDCTTATSGNISFNKLFSPTSTAFASSQMAASTNGLEGYAITVSGAQLSDGTNYIPGIGDTGAASKTSASTVGTSVFGMNLVADADANATSPALTALTPAEAASAAITPASDGTSYMGIAHANFNTDSTYGFKDSGTNGLTLALNDIAGSDYAAGGPTGAAKPTDAQIYTATYMVNVAANQPAGSYVTTLTYICTPTF